MPATSDDARTAASGGGEFVRQPSRFRDRVTADGSTRLPGRGRPLPPVRLLRVPVGAPHGDRAPPEGARGRDRRCRSSTRSATSAAGPSPAASTSTRSTAGASSPRPTRPPSRLRRARHGPGAVGHRDGPDRQQRVGRHPAHAADRLRRARRAAPSTSTPSRSARRSTRSTSTSTTRQQRRLPRRVRPPPGRLRARGARHLRDARPSSTPARRPPLPVRRRTGRDGLARCSRRSCASTPCTHPLQVQPAPRSSTTRSCGRTCATSTSSRGSPRPFASTRSAPLLPHASVDEPERPGRAAARRGLRRAARATRAPRPHGAHASPARSGRPRAVQRESQRRRVAPA